MPRCIQYSYSGLKIQCNIELPNSSKYTKFLYTEFYVLAHI